MPIPIQAKIVKKGSAGPDQFELSIAQALLELENNSDLKAQLRELYITKAKEIELLGKKVITNYLYLKLNIMRGLKMSFILFWNSF